VLLRLLQYLLRGAIVSLVLPAHAYAALSSGAYGFFNPAADITLDVPANGVFEFTDVNIGSGITVTFRGVPSSISWLAQNDINIGGTLYAPGWSLALDTPASFVMSTTGSITAANVSINARSIELFGGSLTANGGRVTLAAGEDLSITKGSIIDISSGALSAGGTLSISATGSLDRIVSELGGVVSLSPGASIELTTSPGTVITVLQPEPVPLPHAALLLVSGLALLGSRLRGRAGLSR
jgi:adhesin HecA-like repeat protein